MDTNKISSMDKDEYIKALEGALVFMCATYMDYVKLRSKLAQEKNPAFMEFPIIQQSVNSIGIEQLSKYEKEIKPYCSFSKLEEEFNIRNNLGTATGMDQRDGADR